MISLFYFEHVSYRQKEKKIVSESTMNSLPFLINTTFLIPHQPLAKSSITDVCQLARLLCKQTSKVRIIIFIAVRSSSIFY